MLHNKQKDFLVLFFIPAAGVDPDFSDLNTELMFVTANEEGIENENQNN